MNYKEKQRKCKALSKRKVLIWNSRSNGTYERRIHGEIRTKNK